MKINITATDKNYIFSDIPLFYVLTMFAVFPLYYDDKFFNIVQAKFSFFMAGTIMALLCVLFAVFFCKELLLNFIRAICSRETFLLVVFLLLNILSGILSPYKSTVILGIKDRYNGILLMTLYLFAFIIALTVKGRNRFMELIRFYAVSSTIVYILAILNFYGVDPLHMYARSSDQMATIYLSTIGNINFLGTFLCLSLPLFLYHAIYQKSLLQRIIFSIVTCIGLAAAIVVNSDSMYFGLMLVIVIIICMRGFNICLANSLLTIGAVFSFECFILGIFASKMANKYQALRSISKLLCNAYVSTFLLLLCVALIAVISLCKKQKRQILYADISKITRIVCLMFAVIICLLIIYVNIKKPTAEFMAFNNLFVFNDAWGSNRGFVWERLLNIFSKVSPWQKLFGTGPDSVNFLINPNYTEYIITLNGSTFDSAHNEYLQYLLCIGLIGLGSYLAFIASILQKAFKAKKHMANGFALCICAYLAQAIFNIAMPITTPLFFIICALAVTSAKRKGKVQQ